MTAFFATLQPMLIMFIFIAVGFILAKIKAVPETSATVLSKIENYFLVPCLILSTFIKYCTLDSIERYGTLLIYSVIMLAAAMALAICLARFFAKDQYQRCLYKYALTFGNLGFMGNAIAPMILGEDHLIDYMIFCLPMQVAIYTWGLYILIPKNGERALNPLSKLMNPVFISIVIGVTVGLLRQPVSGWLNRINPMLLSNLAVKAVLGSIDGAIEKSGACMGPVAMLLTGMVIGKFNIKQLISNKRVYVASTLRLIIIPAVFVGLLRLLTDGDSLVIGVALIAYSTPLGLNTVVFPAAYGGDTSTGAAMATISHTLAVLTIPLMCVLFGVGV